MIKKILLLVVTALSVVACSKDDNKTLDNMGGNDRYNITNQVPLESKLVGTWVGTYEIVAEKQENQARLIELLKENDEKLNFINYNNDYTKARVKFECLSEILHTYHVTFYHSNGSFINRFDYKIEDNKIVDVEKNVPYASYTLEGDKLTGEVIDYRYDDMVDVDAMTKESVDTGNFNLRELKKKYTYKYKRKFTLTKQQ